MALKLCFGTKGHCIEVICSYREATRSSSLLKALTTECFFGREINAGQSHMEFGTLRRTETSNPRSFECELSICSV